MRRIRNVRSESEDRFEGNQADNVVPHSENDPSSERIEGDEDFQEHPEELLDIFCRRLRMIENVEGHLEENGRVGGRLGENNRVGGRFEDLIEDVQGEVLLSASEDDVIVIPDSEDDVIVIPDSEDEEDETGGLSAERIQRFHHFDAGADLAGEQLKIISMNKSF